MLFKNFLLLLMFQFISSNKGCQFYPPGEYLRFVRVPENLPVGGKILSLEVYPRDSLSLQPVEKEEDLEFFTYQDESTRTIAITLNKSLEDLVDSDQPQNILKFRLGCNYQDGQDTISAYMSITVYVEDINDHSPKFINAPYKVEVDELTPIGVTVFRGISATDRDKPNTPNSDIQYSLSGEYVDIFKLENSHRPNVILQESLDYDQGQRDFDLVVMASDRGTPPRVANTTVHIRVLDNDDLGPIFTEGVYRTQITEYFPITGQALHRELEFQPPIRAFDQDRSLNAELKYDIISGNERNLFILDSKTGKLFLEEGIDLEQETGLPGNSFVLQVQATQVNNPLRTAVARVEVEILDLNDNVPEFEVDFYNISIVENLPNGFSVLQVIATDRDQGENSEFSYKIVGDSPPGAFSVDSRTGWLIVQDQGLLDREARGSLSLGVRAKEKIPSVVRKDDSLSTVNVEITLLDANDNNPEFLPSNLYEFITKKDAKPGDVVGQLKSRDPDLGRNGLVLYELQKSRNITTPHPFHLDPQTGNLTISSEGSLNYRRYTLFVEGSDQPANPSERRTSIAVVTVEVMSLVDSLPEFIGAPYEFWVGANVGIGTSVGHIRITGGCDEGDVTYDLLHGYHTGVPFAVEERSGTVTVVRDISDFDRSLYDFEAAATHSASDVVLVANVTIHVVDPDDERGILMRGTGASPIEFKVRENLSGALVGQLLYRNGSMGDVSNATKSLRFIIANQQDVTNYIAIGQDGTLYTLKGLDRETRDVFRMTVIAEYNKGIVSGAGIYQVTVYVEDENDNPPIFQHPFYNGTILENSPKNTEVTLNYLINATDADLDQNAQFSFVTAGEGRDLFKINQTTGRVFYIGDKILDRETTPTYVLRVMARDKGGLSSEVKLTINVEDVNDNAPVFTELLLMADQGIDVLAFDEKNSSMTILEEQKNNLTFLYTTIPVRAIGPTRKSESTVPLLSLPENILVGSEVLKLTAYDKDTANNSVVTYSMVSETFIPYQIMPRQIHVRHFFMVEANDGKIIVSRPLPAEAEFRLNISAEDAGGLKDFAILKIVVRDVNDHAPVFLKSSYNFDVLEAVYSRSILGRLEAKDADYAQNANVSYDIITQEVLPFKIAELSGVLSVNGKLDREERDTFSFIVRASDHGAPGTQMTSTVGVEVHVLDVNDNAPVFYGYDEIIKVEHPESSDLPNHNFESVLELPVYYATVAENTPIGTPVTRLFANDSDFTGNGNGLFLFDISQRGNPTNLFAIDSKDGILVTTGKIDYETQSSFNITVVASDFGNPSLSSTALLIVKVIDIPEDSEENDSEYMFMHRYYEVEVEENLPSPIELITLNVTEPFRKHRVRFQILPEEVDYSDKFSINPENGTLYLIKSLDREEQDIYTLKIGVDKLKVGRNIPVMLYPMSSDSFQDLHPNEVKVVVRVKDVNDNAPKFTSNGRPIVAVIPSTANFGYPVLKLQATDIDLGYNAEIRYQLLNEKSRRFAIDAITGRVRALAAFERDSQRVYGFDVKATDKRGADDGRSAIANVFVYVLDESKQLVMVVGAGPVDVERSIGNMTAALRGATGLDVRVRLLEPHTGKSLGERAGHSGATDVYIYAVDPRSNAVVDMQTLQKTLKVEENSIRQSLSPLPVLEVASLRPAVGGSRPGRLPLTGLELGAVALGVAVFAGALATALCIACVRRNKRRPKPAFTHPQLAGMLAEAKPVGPGGMYAEGPSLYGESDSYTGISTKSQQPLCPHGNPLHGERHLGCPTQKPSDSCDRRQRRVQDASNQGVMEASATSLYSSGQDSGIVITRPTRYTAPCPCGHSDHQSSDDSSNGSYEDSLKSSPLEVRHDPSFATPSLPRKSLQRATNQWRRGHSFTEGTMKDDLTQGSPGLLQRAPLASLPPLTTVNHIVYRSHSHRPPPVKKSFRIKDNQGLSTKYNSRLKTLEFKNRGEPLKVEVSIPNLRNSGVPLRSDIQRHL